MNSSSYTGKIDLNDLYEVKHARDLKQLNYFNNILAKVHSKIKNVSRQVDNDTCCWYVIPERIFGSVNYDQGTCIAYIIDKLVENKFNVKHFFPNIIFISWNHWVPNYIRHEIRSSKNII